MVTRSKKKAPRTAAKPRKRPAKPVKKLGRPPRRPGAFGPPAKTAPPELLALLEKAKTADEILAALSQVSLLAAKGTIATSTGKLAVEIAREVRQVEMNLRKDEAPAGVLVNAIDILLPDERAVLDAYRASKTVPPLKPGEAVAPPELSDEERAKRPPRAEPTP